MCCQFVFYTDTATTEISTYRPPPSHNDSFPICAATLAEPRNKQLMCDVRRSPGEFDKVDVAIVRANRNRFGAAIHKFAPPPCDGWFVDIVERLIGRAHV